MRYFFILLNLYSISTLAQFEQAPTNFVNHLLNNKLYDEAILVLRQKVAVASEENADSLNLLIGKTYYTLQQLPSSISFLDRVTNNNETLFSEAKLFSSFNEAYLKRFPQAYNKLVTTSFKNSKFEELKSFQLSGIFLLLNNFQGFDSLKTFVKSETPLIQLQYKNFKDYRQRLAEEQQKSSVKAGLLSAIVPGLGKVYAGRRGNGLYVFLISSLLAAQTYEAYRKDGIASARFIIYSSLFSSFYIGNIWGSALAVRVVRNEKVAAIHEQILFDMHIPLRTIFR